jgi:LuxR family transcriptional regulator, regulator of acetate metabolism
MSAADRRNILDPLMDNDTVTHGMDEAASPTPISIESQVRDPYADGRRRIREALERLGSTGSSELIRTSAPRELAQACGFTRAMVSAVRGSRWVPLQLYTRDDLDPRASAFRAYVESDAEIPLANLLAETDMVRRRTAVLVDETVVGGRAFKLIIEIAQSSAYVAAPILVEGRTIGFVHADRVGQRRPVDEDDRRYIQAFTGELAVLYQRMRWSERVTERGRRALGDLDRAAAALELIGSGTAGLPTTRAGSDLARSDAAGFDGEVRRDGFLTAREWEVLDHVADGATNRVIAQRLSLSEDTVKTHMRSVLRKLRVTTRGAAVARYIEISRGLR